MRLRYTFDGTEQNNADMALLADIERVMGSFNIRTSHTVHCESGMVIVELLHGCPRTGEVVLLREELRAIRSRHDWITWLLTRVAELAYGKAVKK